MAKKNVSEIERGVGYFMGFTTNLMDIVREKNISFEVIYRLATPAGRATLEKMVEVALADWSAEQPKPREPKGSPYRGTMPSNAEDALQTFRLHVSYAKLAGVKALEPKFSGKDSVSALFDGRVWERHSSCVTIDETPGEREFMVAEIPEEFLGKRIDAVRDALSAYFDAKGFRFAIETEAVEFAEAQPELQRKNWILALGSSALSDDGDRCVALLDALDRDRVLDGSWVGHVLDGDARLLLVRKVS